MSRPPFKYRKAKFVVAETYIVDTPIKGYDIRDEFFWLAPSGRLYLYPGLAWNGASGPTLDTDDCILASAVHDVFCWLMRDGRISYALWQDTVNELFRQMCLDGGMWKFRAGYWHWAVEFADAGNPDQGPDPSVKVLVAP